MLIASIYIDFYGQWTSNIGELRSNKIYLLNFDANFTNLFPAARMGANENESFIFMAAIPDFPHWLDTFFSARAAWTHLLGWTLILNSNFVAWNNEKKNIIRWFRLWFYKKQNMSDPGENFDRFLFSSVLC